MSFFNKVITYFAPHLILKELEAHNYHITEKETVRLNLIIIFPLISLTYILHYFYFDQPMGLTKSSSFWFYFRFGMATTCSLGFLIYSKIIKTTASFYRLYATLTTSSIIILQAIATKLYPEAPALYPYVFTLVSIYLLRLSVIQNILFCLVNTYCASYFLLQTSNAPQDIYSAAFITIVITLFISSRNLSSILLYKSNLENLEAQKQLIERQIEIVDHLRGFLPKQIFNRFHELSSVRKYPTTYALDEILRPKNKHICCLFSDIRGYTQRSRDYDFLEKDLLPIIKDSSITIENNYGIPRKIGDLVFAYFDEDSNQENILNSFRSSLMMAIKQQNSSKKETITRSIILSSGPAIVGNIGGNDSSIEITAMGTPSNECARIDEFIKKDTLFYNKIVFTPSFLKEINKLHRLDCKSYKLKRNEVIRDFETINSLHYISFSEAKNILNDTWITKAGAA